MQLHWAIGTNRYLGAHRSLWIPPTSSEDNLYTYPRQPPAYTPMIYIAALTPMSGSSPTASKEQSICWQLPAPIPRRHLITRDACEIRPQDLHISSSFLSLHREREFELMMMVGEHPPVIIAKDVAMLGVMVLRLPIPTRVAIAWLS